MGVPLAASPSWRLAPRTARRGPAFRPRTASMGAACSHHPRTARDRREASSAQERAWLRDCNGGCSANGFSNMRQRQQVRRHLPMAYCGETPDLVGGRVVHSKAPDALHAGWFSGRANPSRAGPWHSCIPKPTAHAQGESAPYLIGQKRAFSFSAQLAAAECGQPVAHPAAKDCFWPIVRVRRRFVDDGNRWIVIATTGPCVSGTIASSQTMLRCLRLYCP